MKLNSVEDVTIEFIQDKSKCKKDHTSTCMSYHVYLSHKTKTVAMNECLNIDLEILEKR